jgi:hypothetical protein
MVETAAATMATLAAVIHTVNPNLGQPNPIRTFSITEDNGEETDVAIFALEDRVLIGTVNQASGTDTIVSFTAEYLRRFTTALLDAADEADRYEIEGD